MITDAEIDRAIAILEDPQAAPYDKAVASDIAAEYIEQEMMCCTRSRKDA